MNYKYVNDLDGISQYDDFDLENNKIVNARYIHALVDEDREIEKGNDSVLRTPHMKEGNTGRKTDLISKPE